MIVRVAGVEITVFGEHVAVGMKLIRAILPMLREGKPVIVVPMARVGDGWMLEAGEYRKPKNREKTKA